MKTVAKNKLLLGAVLPLLPLAGTHAQNKAKESAPNVLFIMSDDHAEKAISAYGSEFSRLAPTPNIDRIANEGALFQANYCCNSLSGPSRASVMSGKHSHANGFMRNGNKFDGSQLLVQKVFQENGYQTALIGKWHLVTKPTGFDYWTILNDQGEYYNPDFITEKDTVRIDGYVTDIITEKTINWLDHRDRYASMSLSYDMNGKLFNRIPLIKNLKWREMFRVRALWGTLTDKNNPFKSNNPDLFRFPTRDGKFTSFVMDPKVPYIEGSVGIYNIFKLLHVEYVHRFTYRDNPGINKNGIRFMVLMVF